MKKIRLSEKDLQRIVKRTISEMDDKTEKYLSGVLNHQDNEGEKKVNPDRQPITFDYVREIVADYLEDNPEDLEGIPSDKLDDAYDNIAEGIMIEFRDNMDNLWNYPSFDSLIWVYTDEFKDYD